MFRRKEDSKKHRRKNKGWWTTSKSLGKVVLICAVLIAGSLFFQVLYGYDGVAKALLEGGDAATASTSDFADKPLPLGTRSSPSSRHRRGSATSRSGSGLDEEDADISNDDSPSRIVLTSVPRQSSNDTRPTFAFRPRPDCRGVRGKLDNATSWTSISSPHRVKERLREGWHVMRLLCRRQHSHQRPLSFRWRVDLTPPRVRLLRMAPKITKDSSAMFLLESSERDCHFLTRVEYKSREDEMEWQDIFKALGARSRRRRRSKQHSQAQESASESASSESTLLPEIVRTRLTKHEVKVLLSNLSEGIIKASFRAVDQAGNVGTATEFVWVIDKTAPQTKILSSPKKVDTSSNVTFVVTSPSEKSTDSYVVEYSLDGTQWHMSPIGSSSNFMNDDGDDDGDNEEEERNAYIINFVDISDGPHKVLFRAKDIAGNVDTNPASFEWVAHVSQTDTKILSGPPRISNRASELFVVSSSESKYSFSYKLDDGDAVRPNGIHMVTGPQNFTVNNITDGPHRLEVRSLDVTGSEDPSPAVYEWTADLSPPACSFLQKPENISASSTATFDVRCSEPYFLSYSIDGGSWINISEATSVARKQLNGTTSLTPLDDSDPDAGERSKLMNSSAITRIRLGHVGEGRHSLDMLVFDSLSNRGSISYEWIRDTGPPELKVVETPDKQSKGRNPKFRVACSERGCSYHMRVDRGAWRNLQSKRNRQIFHVKSDEDSEQPGIEIIEFSLTNVKPGFHVVDMYATDSAGNRQANQETYEFVVF